jgi:uncharacterized membrane protein
LGDRIEQRIDQWLSAGIVNASTAARIREFESQHSAEEHHRWPVTVALALGAILVCAGVLLFVAAHWDELSPGARFALVLVLVAAFPIAGALVRERFPALSLTFYALGTVCTGAGIFLSAQIFNLQEHWPSGILLWAIAAVAAWLLVRHWSQAVIVATLLPAWLAGEWIARGDQYHVSWFVLAAGLLLLSFTYLSALTEKRYSNDRIALAAIGSVALIPCGLLAFFVHLQPVGNWQNLPNPSFSVAMLSWAIAIGVPLLLAFVLRGKDAWMNGIAAVWVIVIGSLPTIRQTNSDIFVSSRATLALYVWAAVGALGLVSWGFYERRSERINLGIAAFALTVAVFYFSNVMDKLGRSASLITMGALFLLGGWALERVRRSLLAQMRGAQA